MCGCGHVISRCEARFELVTPGLVVFQPRVCFVLVLEDSGVLTYVPTLRGDGKWGMKEINI